MTFADRAWACLYAADASHEYIATRIGEAGPVAELDRRYDVDPRPTT